MVGELLSRIHERSTHRMAGMMAVTLLKHNRGNAIHCTAGWYAEWLRAIADNLTRQGALDAEDARAIAFIVDNNHVPATVANG